MKKSILVKAILSFLIINLILISIVSLIGGRIVTLSLKSDSASEIQFFYVTKDNNNFNESNSTKTICEPSNELTKVRSFIFTKDIDKFRIDFGNSPSKYEVEYLSISDGLFSKKVWNTNDFIKDFKNNQQIQIYKTNNDNLEVTTLGNDGFVSSDSMYGETRINTKIILLEIMINLALIILFTSRGIKKYSFKVLNNVYVKNLKMLFNKHNNGIKFEFNNFKEFILSNKYIIYITIFFTILAHGVAIFYYKIGIDSEKAIINYNPQGWIVQGRFGIALLKKIFHTETITVPAYNIFLGLVALILFIILSIYIMNKYSKKQNKLANIGFIITFITFSQISTYMTFVMYSFEVSIAYFIVALSVLFTSRAILDKGNILDFVLGIVLLMIAISIYQSFITLYVSFVCIIFLINSNKNKNKDIDTEIINIGKFIVVLVIAIAIYFFINFILTNSIMNAEGYLGNFIGWKSNGIWQVILQIISSIGTVIMGKSLYGSKILRIYYIIMPLIMIVALVKSKKIINFIYLIGFMLSPFLFNIVLGAAQPIRSLVTLPFFVGMFSYIMILIVKNRNIQRIIFIGIFLSGMYQAETTSSLYFGDYIRYQQDIQLGNSIAQKIEGLYLGEIPKYPIVYVGAHSQQGNKLIVQNEVIGYSFFEWDQGNIYRINSFMNILGHSYMAPSQDEIKKAYEISKNMPIWPYSESVKFENNVVVVKLSEPTEGWKQRYGIE